MVFLPEGRARLVLPEGEELVEGLEAVVLAADRRPQRSLADEARKRGIEVHLVGDAAGVEAEGQGTVMAAIASGYDVGRMI